MITVKGTITEQIALIINTAIQYGRSANMEMDDAGNWFIQISEDGGKPANAETEVPPMPM